MYRLLRYALLVGLLGLGGLVAMPARAGTLLQEPIAAPAFTHASPAAWINSAPLKLTDLRGQVVLMDVWTFDCWNCYRSFPWLTDLEDRLADDPFQVIGIHSPEFEHERGRSNIVAKADEFGLDHPIMIDNDFSYWRALDNRYWPTFYIIDKRGRIRAVFIGEIRGGEPRARRIETIIRQLLQEDAAGNH